MQKPSLGAVFPVRKRGGAPSAESLDYQKQIDQIRASIAYMMNATDAISQTLIMGSIFNGFDLLGHELPHPPQGDNNEFVA